MPSMRVNGIDLYYEDVGNGPPLVFLHGGNGNHLSWWQQIPAFQDRYRCIAIDHRGFGRSPDLTGEGHSRYVDDLEALLDALGVETASLVAQSMGGRTAIGFTVRHPGRVQALAMAATWGGIDWPELREEARRLDEVYGRGGRSSLDMALGSSFRDRQPALVFLYRHIAGLNPPRPKRDEIENAPSAEQVAEIRMPVLFLVGSEDMLTPPPLIRRMHALIDGSVYVELPGLGHSAYFENAAAFNSEIGAFLADAAATATGSFTSG